MTFKKFSPQYTKIQYICKENAQNEKIQKTKYSNTKNMKKVSYVCSGLEKGTATR